MSVRRFLFASTFGVYDWDRVPQAPLAEDFPLAPGEVYYLASKVASERLLTLFAREYGLEFAILRFAQIYGRGHFVGGDYLGIAMHAALSAALAGTAVDLDPGIVTINDHVYAKDVALGCALACEKPLTHEVYNIGSGRLTGPADVAAAIDAAIPGTHARVLPEPVLGPFWRHEQMLDLTRARDDFGYEPHFDLTSGVRDFARDLAEHPHS